MRIRTIKPEFFLHDALFNAEKESKLPLRLAFAGLWCAADREGRFKWEPRRLGIQILPYDGIDFSRVLDALTTRAFVVRYACGTGVYGVIPSFPRHQVINNRERESDLPDPAQCAQNEGIDASVTRGARVGHAGKEEGKGREQGREGNKEQGEASLPFSSLEFFQAWKDWTNHRTEIKKPLKPTQIEKQLQELQSIGEQRAVAMINHTIAKGWQGLREPESSVASAPDHPRCAEFLSVFTECYQAFTSSAYPLGDNDRAALNRLLIAIPDITTEEFRDNIEGCQRAATHEGKFANKILTHTGNLAAFCSNWSGIVAYSQTYQESKK